MDFNSTVKGFSTEGFFLPVGYGKNRTLHAVRARKAVDRQPHWERSFCTGECADVL